MKKNTIRKSADQYRHKNSQVSTRSLITERDKADMLYQKEIINIVQIALVFLILALTNIANNMKFRVQTRKRETPF